jgi:predicted O-methyltransferase YrrM
VKSHAGPGSPVSTDAPMSEQPADPFAHIRAATHDHRRRHGCGAYPYGNGALLGALAAGAAARRILELGTALGYSALWFAHGAADAIVDTIDRDEDHVRLARQNVEACGLAGHVVVHHGEFAAVLPGLDPGYDIAFFDGFTPGKPLLAALTRLLRTEGMLISANLTHEGGEAYRDALLNARSWLTAFIDQTGETAISVKR